ncbi:MAG: hypothetical protein PHP53_18755 [Prolixibacteraceae bacterium]|nr:hypothetical protein [Prolixibacteraceae bacterium]
MRAFLILVIFLIFLSCEKESDYTIVIGNDSKNFEIVKLDPLVSILPSGKDSLDLNSDGTFDIVFIKSPKPATYGYSSETNILIKNGVQVALSKINNYPDTLNMKAVLNDNLNWSTGVSSKLILQSFECGGISGCQGFANFLDVSDKYIGFKTGGKFGWIKVDNNVYELKIKEYTVLK